MSPPKQLPPPPMPRMPHHRSCRNYHAPPSARPRPRLHHTTPLVSTRLASSAVAATAAILVAVLSLPPQSAPLSLLPTLLPPSPPPLCGLTRRKPPSTRPGVHASKRRDGTAKHRGAGDEAAAWPGRGAGAAPCAVCAPPCGGYPPGVRELHACACAHDAQLRLPHRASSRGGAAAAQWPRLRRVARRRRRRRRSLKPASRFSCCCPVVFASLPCGGVR